MHPVKKIILFLFLLSAPLYAQKEQFLLGSVASGVLSPLIYTGRYGAEQPVMRLQYAMHYGVSLLQRDGDRETEWRIGVGNSRYQFRGNITPEYWQQYVPYPLLSRKIYVAGNYEWYYFDIQYGWGKIIHFNRLRTDTWKLSGNIGLRLTGSGKNDRDGGFFYTDTANGNRWVYIVQPDMTFRLVSPEASAQFARHWRFPNHLNIALGAELNLGLLNLAKGTIRLYPGASFESGAKVYYNGGYLGLRFGMGWGPLRDPEKETDGQIHLVAGRKMHLIPWTHTWFAEISAGASFAPVMTTANNLHLSFTAAPGWGFDAGVRLRLNKKTGLQFSLAYQSHSIAYRYNTSSSWIPPLSTTRAEGSDMLLFHLNAFQLNTALAVPIISRKWFRSVFYAGTIFDFRSAKRYNQSAIFDTVPDGLLFNVSRNKPVSVLYQSGISAQFPRRLGNLLLSLEFVYDPVPVVSGTVEYFSGTGFAQQEYFRWSATVIQFKAGYIFDFSGYEKSAASAQTD